MSSVLDIDGLAESPLADLHALAAELGVEDYRLRRKSDLTVAILVARGAEESAVREPVERKFGEIEAAAAARAAAEEVEEQRREQERAEQAAQRRERQRPAPGREGGGEGRRPRDGQGRSRAGGQRRDQRERGGRERGSRERGDRERDERGARGERGGREQRGQRREQAEGQATPKREAETFEAAGVFEPRQGGSGMLRAELGARSPKDVEVARSEIRKYRLFRGDAVTGTAKKSRRAKGAGLLTDVTAVNGQPPGKHEGERVRFDEASTTPPSSQLAKRLFKAAPFGRGSRALVVGPARGAASEMLMRLAEQIAGEGVHTTMAVVAAPADGTRSPLGQGYEVISGTLAGEGKEFTTGLGLAVERGKRLAEAGRDAAIVIDGIDLLPPELAREIVNAARKLTEHGSLTVIGSAAPGGELEALAGTTAVISDGRKLKLDRKKSWSSFK